MVRNARKLVSIEAEAVGRSGKLQGVFIALTGDRVWNLRETDVSGNIIYKVSCGVAIPHTDLGIGFKGALFAEVDAGTTGEINIVYE